MYCSVNKQPALSWNLLPGPVLKTHSQSSGNPKTGFTQALSVFPPARCSGCDTPLDTNALSHVLG